jgi:UMF1 family MFS transporter
MVRNASEDSWLSNYVSPSSQSNEADDEASLTERISNMDEGETWSPPRYEGEDTRLTSDKELAGFYMYGWAAEVCLDPGDYILFREPEPC